MGFLGNVHKAFNPIKLLTDGLGGWVGNIARIATTVISGLASGRPINQILKDVLKDVVALAIKMAITAFTGGTAGLFINQLVDKMQGILGDVAGKVLASGLSKPIAAAAANTIQGFAKSLSTDVVRKQISDVVLSATGLPNEDAYLDPKRINQEKLREGLNGILLPRIDASSWNAPSATYSMGRDEFVTRR